MKKKELRKQKLLPFDLLTEEETKAISTTFAKKLGKKDLRIENIVDSNLLGGIKLRIGNRIYDGSLQGKLERLERQLLR